MNGYDNTYDEGEGAPQNKYSEINTIDSEEQIIPGPGNASFFDLSRKHLRQFPEYLYDECLYVKYLYLEGNLLQELCEIFFPALPSLKWLDVRNNFLTSLPRSIANHPNLEVLLLQGNQIRVLPLELGLVPKLRGIQLLGNPITFPPQDVLEHGVKSVIEFLRDEHNIQAPSPSTIRPIAEPFYKSTESREGKMKTRSGQKRKSPALVKKRAVSSNLPPITVKSYQKPDSKSDPPRPKTSQPVCRYQLAMTPPTQNDIEVTEDMSTRIQSVGNKILQLWPHPTDMCKREAKIRDNLLKEMFVARIRYMLQQQAAIIQRTKDREVLRKWRQTGAPIRQRQVSMELPYDTDPNYMTMMSRTELQNPSSRQKQQQTQQTVTTNIGEEMSEIFKSLQKMDDSKKNVTLSPRAEQSILNNEIQMLVRLQKKLQVLHFKNMHEEISIPSLPVRGQRVSVEERKKKP